MRTASLGSRATPGTGMRVRNCTARSGGAHTGKGELTIATEPENAETPPRGFGGAAG